LQWAAAEQRVLVTMDKDFGELVFAERAAHSA
jgi:predicted nuclease of predicted toxin-antitoxin system